MKLDVSALFTEGSCRVVFAPEPETSFLVEDAVLEAYPRYETKTNEAFLPKKLGPFTIKNNKCIWDILYKPKCVSIRGQDFLTNQMEKMDVLAYQYRRPRAMALNQMKRVSILYDILNGRREFFLNDCATRYNGEVNLNKDKDSPCTVSKFMKEYGEKEKVPYSFVWVTGMTPSELFEKLGEITARSSFYSFFTVIGDRVVKCDKAELFATRDPNQSVPQEYLVDETVEEDEPEIIEEEAIPEKKPFILD